ncbi:PAN2-PAN3 deadenylation complex subunit PAN3 isoform X3 [Neocloeon triangulifer]|uniref:PAN2-PAN3 deadenylation complex subunit PAN3 isoform X3 n=1 Tax=Neocloeon triangulifer TaxID=2078957 RepID=UPI00286F75D1|nr:PAN2-PAN3 deadenylation complex subunit PAN3 isoform X3 [Neocloeon triangulifer]
MDPTAAGSEKMDVYGLMFNRPNGGVPQESKLATYMGTASTSQVLNKGIASLSLDNLSMKKVLGNEFVPNSASAGNFTYSGITANAESPAAKSYNPEYAGEPSASMLNSTSQRLARHRETPPLDALGDAQNMSMTSTYQENVGGTTYFYPTSGTGSSTPTRADSSPMVMPNFHAYPGTPSHLTKAPSASSPNRATQPTQQPSMSSTSHTTHLTNSLGSYYLLEEFRLELLNRNALVLAQPNGPAYPDLPAEIDNYHELCSLEPVAGANQKTSQVISYQTSTLKATHTKSGARFCLRRVHGFRLANLKCMANMDSWKRIQHSNIVQIKEVFTTKAFNDNSIVFVYDYHPGAETLMSKHFSASDQANGFPDPFNGDHNVARPYSHTKNALLRQHASLLPEPLIWSYVIQLTSALRTIHNAGLAYRCLHPSKVILTDGNVPRLRLSFCGIADVVMFDATANVSMATVHQQEDLLALGRLVLALACKSMLAVKRENIQTSLELVSRSYSSDLRNLIVYLLSNSTRRSVSDLMPMIGARFYTQLDATQQRCDLLENEVSKEIENGRLVRLLTKLGIINERPELNMDQTWSENGDRYMLKLFRDYVFHQVSEDGKPWIDMAHIVSCLNKLDAGTDEQICLMSRDEQSVLVVTYAELKHCLEQSFDEIVQAANAFS